MPKNSYILLTNWLDGITGKQYEIGSKVDLPLERAMELLDKGFIKETATEKKEEPSPFDYEKATYKPKEKKDKK